MDFQIPNKRIEAHSNFGVTASKVQSIVRDQEGTWAVAKFNSEFLGAFSSGKGAGPSNTESPHAEDHAMAALKSLVEQDNSSDKAVGHLTLKISKSPCGRCADRLIQLKNENPQLTIRIKALGLYFGKSTEDRAAAQLAISRLAVAGIPVIRWEMGARHETVLQGTAGTGALSGKPRGRELAITDLDEEDFKDVGGRQTTKFEGVQLASREQYKGIRDRDKSAEIQAALLRRDRMTRIAKLEELIQEQRNRKANLQARLNEIPVPRMPRGVQAMQHERKQLEGEVTACDEAIRVLTVERDGLHRDLNPDAMDDGTD
jgi:hypothetical protein